MRTAVPGSRHSHSEQRATFRQAICPTAWSFEAKASATHLLRSKLQRDTGTPTSLPSWKPAFQFPAQPASKLEAPHIHFQRQEEEQRALLRSDIAKPSSDSFSISEAHGPFPVPPHQHLLSYHERAETRHSQFRH